MTTQPRRYAAATPRAAQGGPRCGATGGEIMSRGARVFTTSCGVLFTQSTGRSFPMTGNIVRPVQLWPSLSTFVVEKFDTKLLPDDLSHSLVVIQITASLHGQTRQYGAEIYE